MDSKGKIMEPPRRPPQAASAAQISAVIGNDDILREILVRLGFPTSLVRAAAVSKRWLRHASDPAFLRRFRRRHPPRLLGFYLRNSGNYWLRFRPLPQPPELAAVIRRGKFDLDKAAPCVSDCRNGRFIVEILPEDGLGPAKPTVCRPLHPGRGATVVPLPQVPSVGVIHTHQFLFHGDDDDTAISTVTVIVSNLWQVRAQLQDFQAGVLGEARNSDMIQLPGELKICRPQNGLLAHGKIYLICMVQYILGLDVQSMTLFSIKLPNGVEYEYDANIALSRAEGSGFCLVHVKMFQMFVWHYTLDHGSTGNWELIDTISLPQVFGTNADPTWFSQGADVRVRVAAVGDNADFVLLMIQQKVFYFHISSRKVEKVYELVQDESLVEITPFMMVWPPTFPTMNGGHDNDE